MKASSFETVSVLGFGVFVLGLLLRFCGENLKSDTSWVLIIAVVGFLIAIIMHLIACRMRFKKTLEEKK